MKRGAAAKTVSEYIRARPKDVRAILEKFRTTIQKAAPEAEEMISYRIPAFKFRGRIIAYFGRSSTILDSSRPRPMRSARRRPRTQDPREI